MKKYLIGLIFALSAIPATACDLKDKRICDIDAILQSQNGGHVVQYKENSTSDATIAAEHEWVIGAPDIIHLGMTQDYSYEELLYLVGHEYGHSILKHTRLMLESIAAPEDKGLSDAALLRKYGSRASEASAKLNHQQEFEADDFAVKILVASNKDALAVMKLVLKGSGSSDQHPSRKSRLNRAQTLVATIAMK